MSPFCGERQRPNDPPPPLLLFIFLMIYKHGFFEVFKSQLYDMIIIIGYYLILSGVVIESNKESKFSSPRLILILYKSESNIEKS
jgi:hypothetical protein